VAISSDRSAIQKQATRNQNIKISNVEHKMLRHTVITGATGAVTKGLKKCLETIPGKHSTQSLQKKKEQLYYGHRTK
jgi:hypothetical protein